MQRMVHREIRRRIFRPMLVEGEPAESGNQVFRHEFYFTEQELAEIRRKKAEAAKREANNR